MARRGPPSRETTSWLGPRSDATTSKRAELSARAFPRALAAAALLALCSCVTVPEFQALRRKVDQLEKGKSGGDEWDGKSGSGGGPPAPSRPAAVRAAAAPPHHDGRPLPGGGASAKKGKGPAPSGGAPARGAARPPAARDAAGR